VLLFVRGDDVAALKAAGAGFSLGKQTVFGIVGGGGVTA